MGLFDGLQDLISNITGSADDVIGNVSENLPVDEIKGAAEDVTGTVNNATEGAASQVEDVKNSLEL